MAIPLTFLGLRDKKLSYGIFSTQTLIKICKLVPQTLIVYAYQVYITIDNLIHTIKKMLYLSCKLSTIGSVRN